MDQIKTGRLIRALRQGQNLTQAELGEKLGVGGKAVSKWECGAGAPDIALLPRLSELLGVDTEALLRGELGENDRSSGNLRRMRFYVCPDCGNLLFSLEGAEVSCCRGGPAPHRHPQRRGLVRHRRPPHDEGSLRLRKLYPQWDLSARLPYFPQGTLLWYDTREGLLSQEVR